MPIDLNKMNDTFQKVDCINSVAIGNGVEEQVVPGELGQQDLVHPSYIYYKVTPEQTVKMSLSLQSIILRIFDHFLLWS